MSKGILLYITAFGLLILAGLIMIHRHSGTLKQDIHDFIPADPEEVDRIEISRLPQLVTLRKVGDAWELKSSGKANPAVVNFFFAGLQRLEIVSPASRADREEISRNIENQGKLVSFYHRSRKLSAFYIGYDSIDVQGTYIMDVRRKLPYRIKLKGYDEVNMENLFSLKMETWQKK